MFFWEVFFGSCGDFVFNVGGVFFLQGKEPTHFHKSSNFFWTPS